MIVYVCGESCNFVLLFLDTQMATSILVTGVVVRGPASAGARKRQGKDHSTLEVGSRTKGMVMEFTKTKSSK